MPPSVMLILVSHVCLLVSVSMLEFLRNTVTSELLTCEEWAAVFRSVVLSVPEKAVKILPHFSLCWLLGTSVQKKGCSGYMWYLFRKQVEKSGRSSALC